MALNNCVRINNNLAPLRTCTMGVPEGLILGPLLFNIKYLPSVCNDGEIVIYAGDTVQYTPWVK